MNGTDYRCTTDGHALGVVELQPAAAGPTVPTSNQPTIIVIVAGPNEVATSSDHVMLLAEAGKALRVIGERVTDAALNHLVVRGERKDPPRRPWADPWRRKRR